MADYEMQDRGEKFLPAFFVEPVELGQEFPKGEWPLHMSYFPPVSASLRPEHVKRLREYINPMQPFMATIGDDALFGPAEDVPVKVMVERRELLAVHRKIVSVLQYLPHSTQFRTPFRPHVTVRAGDTTIETGDMVEVGGFSIAATTEHASTWTVIAKIGLKGADMATDARIIKKR